MPNARVIIDFNASREYDRARRRFVAHLHLAPPMNFTTATTLNAKANAAVDKLYNRDLLPAVGEVTAEEIRDILDGTDRDHDLLDDELAVLACGALNPHANAREAKAVNEAIVDLTGARPKVDDRTQLAAEVALRGFPADKRLTALRSVLERAWRWSALRSVELSRLEPLDLLAEAEDELDETDGSVGPATAELATLASYHLVAARTQLLTRSEYGGRGSNTEPQQILRQLTKSAGGPRQLCQVVLDGRFGRDPQALPDGVMPKNKRFLRSEKLTASRLRELAQISGEQSVTHESPEDLFAAAIDSAGEFWFRLRERVPVVTDEWSGVGRGSRRWTRRRAGWG